MIAPHHPGWGNSALPDWLRHGRRSRLPLSRSGAALESGRCGAGRRCFGGWIAAEMAVRDTQRFAAWCWPIRSASRSAACWTATSPTCTPSRARNSCASPGPIRQRVRVDYTQLPDTELAAIARGREAFALFGWKPYMHNPRLKRWLHRIDVPTLLMWGEQDGIVSPRIRRGLARRNSRRRVRDHPARGTFPALGTAGRRSPSVVSRFIDTTL